RPQPPGRCGGTGPRWRGRGGAQGVRRAPHTRGEAPGARRLDGGGPRGVAAARPRPPGALAGLGAAVPGGEDDSDEQGTRDTAWRVDDYRRQGLEVFQEALMT